MKYLKKFEDTDFEDHLVIQMKKEAWKVDMSVFKESLYKLAILYNIDITEKDIIVFEYNIKFLSVTKFIYITYHKQDDFFGWNDILIENDYTYMGEVEITPEDIQKYNIWIKSNKYNL